MSDDIVHISNLRIRATGTGNLDVRLIGLYEESIVADNPPTQNLVPYALQGATPRLAQFHANFEQQYTQVEISTDVIDEYFKITKITVFAKPVAVAYPM